MRYLNVNKSYKPIKVCNKTLYYLDIVDFTDEEIATDEFKFAIESEYLKPYDVPEIVEEPTKKKRKRKAATENTEINEEVKEDAIN